ncbi:DUF418 domain-containing protein [Henriciella sp.]|uniref:DUF418 domain-containing protein n=1 Tax=Henriciella sp. TaxID=1968823 RepID=UPI002623C650|nr:DUF418 domain-containing protein [Henriciella sp.]
MSYLSETREAGREVFPDLARAFALIGIALVNVAVFSHPMMGGYSAEGALSGADKWSYFLVNAFFLMKSYTLFSFMFGVGFAYQMKAAERRGVGFAGRYWRRITGLLVLGLLHVALLFQGDILVIYAILGCLLYVFRNKEPSALIRWAVWLYVIQILVVLLASGSFILGMTMAPEVMGKQIAANDELIVTSREVFGAGTFVQSIAQRFTEWSSVITFGMLMQGIGAMAFFVFGLAAVRMGSISDPSRPFWKRCRHVFLPIGIFGSAIGAWFIVDADGGMMSSGAMLGMIFITAFSPFSTAGYLGLIAKWAETPDGALKIFLARGGTASLTAYLLQSLIFSLAFNNYGLGYFDEMSAVGTIILALIVGFGSIALSSLWRLVFPRGPMEFLLRRWTYLGAR